MFDELIQELEELRLQKAHKEPDGDEPEEGEDDEADNDEIDFKDEPDEKPVKKSLGGMEVYDGTELIKALSDKFDGRFADINAVLGKTLAPIADLLKSQAGEIDALKATVEKMGSEGRGRKSSLTVHEKPGAADLQKPEGINKETFLAKAESAWRGGKITGTEFATLDSCVRLQETPPPALLTKIFD